MKFTLEIPELSPSNNQLLRMTRFRRGTYQKHWDMLVFAAMNAAGINGERFGPPAQGKRKVTITRHSRGTLEKDNFYGGFKVVFDALRLRWKGKSPFRELIGGNHLIVDDNDKHLVHGPHEQKRCKKGEEKTVIVIEDVEDN